MTAITPELLQSIHVWHEFSALLYRPNGVTDVLID